MELTKQALIDNIIRDYFRVDHKDSYVVSEKKIRDRNRKRNKEFIEKLNIITDQFNDLSEFLSRVFDTRWGHLEENEEFKQIVVKLIVNIAQNIEKIRLEVKK